MTSKLDPDSALLLRTLLEGSEGVLPFAEAVVAHVAANTPENGAREELAGRVAELLRAAEHSDEQLPVGLLSGDPTLLASFFQNADLLDPSAPAAAGVARLVMAALENLDDG